MFFLLNIVYFSICLTSNKLYWTEDQLADVSTRFYTSASWTVGELTGYPIQNADSVKKGVFFVFKNGEHFFLIGYHFEKFRSQVAIRKKNQLKSDRQLTSV